MDLYLDMMTDQYGLSPLAVALVLTSVAVLAMVATYFAEKSAIAVGSFSGSRPSGCWRASWLGINPITWPFRTA
jgi:hypothetical protein